MNDNIEATRGAGAVLDPQRAIAEATQRRDACATVLHSLSALGKEDDQLLDAVQNGHLSARAKLGKVYKVVDAFNEATRQFVACREGCSACCKIAVSITLPEAQALAAQTGRKMVAPTRAIRRRDDAFTGTPCPFLENNQCSAYKVRPFVCRKHVSFATNAHWCEAPQCYEHDFPMAEPHGAVLAHQEIAKQSSLRGFADIRDFFPD
ncbi:MAG: YkgJ family cysteine cluster protein [Betaproteobacteria bacterium]|nr:YkgJ family cysteine cluster protein [Betaproteobacteria bacterium]